MLQSKSQLSVPVKWNSNRTAHVPSGFNDLKFLVWSTLKVLTWRKLFNGYLFSKNFETLHWCITVVKNSENIIHFTKQKIYTIINKPKAVISRCSNGTVQHEAEHFFQIWCVCQHANYNNIMCMVLSSTLVKLLYLYLIFKFSCWVFLKEHLICSHI